MNEPTPSTPNWQAWIRNIAMTALILVGSGTGGYISNTEMAERQAAFQAEIKAELKQLNKRLDKIEERAEE